MTTLLYRGQSYEQGSIAATQLRYDRSVYGERQSDARRNPMLTYRGCTYSVGEGSAAPVSGSFRYRGVAYSR